MPIYEYRCCRCGTEFERLRPLGQATDAGPCPQCGSSEVSRRPSRFASFAKEGGQTHAVAGGSTCGSCTSTSCRSCGKG